MGLRAMLEDLVNESRNMSKFGAINLKENAQLHAE